MMHPPLPLRKVRQKTSLRQFRSSSLFYYLLCSLFCIAVCNFSNGCTHETPNTPGETPVGPVELPDLSVPAVFDWSEVYIKIPIPDGVSIEDITVQAPPLKYGKLFAYSYTFDDDVVLAYGKAFCLINKKWIDAEKFYHTEQIKTTGSIPTKTLGYTDGCGNEHRFSFGVAIWPDFGNEYIDNFMKPTGKNADKYYPYLVWQDLVPLIDFGSDIYLHDVNKKYGGDVDGINQGLQASQDITKKTLGRKIKIIARPNGNNDYITAGKLRSEIVFMSTEGATDDGSAPLRINFSSDIDLYKQSQYRRYTEPIADASTLMSDITAAAAAGNYTWLHDFSHAPADFQYILNLFTAINDNYGKDGNDAVWFASMDEIYEYNYFRNNCTIEKNIVNNTLTLRFSCPTAELANEFQFHRDFSIIIKGVVFPENMEIASGNNVYGLSYVKQGDGSLLVNIDCNKSLLDKAERYTASYEKGKDASAKEDALYFVSRLKEELKRPFQDRIK